jgi:uncharacterized protein (DUF1330 family)
MIKTALLMTMGIVIGAGTISVLHAQTNAPYFLVAEVNIKDQTGYEASGVDKVREAITGLRGGKLIAGGNNKTQTYDGTPPANRFLIFQFPDKATSDRAWNESIKPWQTSENVRKLADFRVFGVAGIGK